MEQENALTLGCFFDVPVGCWIMLLPRCQGGVALHALVSHRLMICQDVCRYVFFRIALGQLLLMLRQSYRPLARRSQNRTAEAGNILPSTKCVFQQNRTKTRQVNHFCICEDNYVFKPDIVEYTSNHSRYSRHRVESTRFATKVSNYINSIRVERSTTCVITSCCPQFLSKCSFIVVQKT